MASKLAKQKKDSVQKMQRTLKRSIHFSGIGLHSGNVVNVSLHPASANTGVVFVRTDLPSRPEIKATPEAVFDTSLATRIGTPQVYVSTVEHFLAATFGLGVDNIWVELDSYELPILDGSSSPFLVLLDEAGVQELETARKVFVVQKAIEVVDPNNPTRFIRIEPHKGTPSITYSIDFAGTKIIGQQSVTMDFTGEAFCREFSYARTFCLAEEVEFMKARGLALGGSLENAIVVSKDRDGVLNQNGLRAQNEFVRHKVLDCIGDLALVGGVIMGNIFANKAGHDLHTALAKKLVEAGAPVSVVHEAGQQSPSKVRFPIQLQDVLPELDRGWVIG
jgi:UDP-3-O-[3-hydroxymyristoyl] N-acetylglucosamine deacetylase